MLKNDRYFVCTILPNFAVDPCDSANGGCEQTCTNNNGVAVCSCTTGILNSDGKNCDPGILYQFILYQTSILSNSMYVENDRYFVYTILPNFAVDPCDSTNGGCEQRCTNNNGVAVCSCTTGILNGNGQNCDPGILYQYILY